MMRGSISSDQTPIIDYEAMESVRQDEISYDNQSDLASLPRASAEPELEDDLPQGATNTQQATNDIVEFLQSDTHKMHLIQTL